MFRASCILGEFGYSLRSRDRVHVPVAGKQPGATLHRFVTARLTDGE